MEIIENRLYLITLYNDINSVFEGPTHCISKEVFYHNIHSVCQRYNIILHIPGRIHRIYNVSINYFETNHYQLTYSTYNIINPVTCHPDVYDGSVS